MFPEHLLMPGSEHNEHNMDGAHNYGITQCNLQHGKSRCYKEGENQDSARWKLLLISVVGKRPAGVSQEL